jgi:hypothetical protein
MASRLDERPKRMYTTDLRHLLESSGAVGPTRRAARTMAQLQTALVAFYVRRRSIPAASKRFKCRKGEVNASLARDNAIVWICPNSRIEGRISTWHATLRDLSDRPASS